MIILKIILAYIAANIVVSGIIFIGMIHYCYKEEKKEPSKNIKPQ